MQIRQPIRPGSSDMIAFHLPPPEAAALRERRAVPLGKLVREYTSPLVALAVDLADDRP
jgi:hypothetical protein